MSATSTVSQKIPLFGQRLFGETNFYFGDAEPSQVLLSMIQNFWTTNLYPPASKITFTSRWTDPLTKTVRPLQISFTRGTFGHKSMNIGSATKYRVDGTVDINIWTLVGAIDPNTQTTMEDALVLHQNMVDEVRRIIRAQGTIIDKKFLLGNFRPMDELEKAPLRLRTMGSCPYILFRSN
jgi:hypothetical protein